MIEKYLKNFNLLPRIVSFKEISEFERFEERFFIIEGNIGDIVGMNVDSVEFIPNAEPPSRDEILSWLWIIHPEFSNDIIRYANQDLITIINEYNEFEE